MKKKQINKMLKTINQYQYEFYVYHALRENIKKSRVYVNNSVGYKSFEEEIKISPNWNKEKDKILKEINNKILLRPIDETLSELMAILEPLIERTNRRALNGENKHITITHHRDGTCSWKIPYPKRNSELDNPFYDKLEIKTISELFDFIEQQCHFIKSMTHIKQRVHQLKKIILVSKHPYWPMALCKAHMHFQSDPILNIKD
ncbi:MAG: hypothetical protein ABI597_09450 [Gammaproteobacteria bacterium]